MKQPDDNSARLRKWSWWTYALIAVAVFALFSVGLVVVGIVVSSMSHGVLGGNK